MPMTKDLLAVFFTHKTIHTKKESNLPPVASNSEKSSAMFGGSNFFLNKNILQKDMNVNINLDFVSLRTAFYYDILTSNIEIKVGGFMLGAIIGDIVGSRFEFSNIKSKDFEIFHEKCFFTDDSVMTLAIAEAIIESENDFTDLSDRTICCMKEIGRNYPNCGYGGMFRRWMYSEMTEPYNSYGNGAAMRVSACGFVGQSLDEVKDLSRKVTEITHNHPEGLKGAEATAVAIFLARTGSSIQEIEDYIDKNYYPMNFTSDEIRSKYEFNETCQGTVPQAIKAFLESTSFEDAIRNAISIGGDSDTIGAITGGIAEAFYGIPEEMKVIAKTYLDGRLKKICEDFEKVYPSEK